MDILESPSYLGQSGARTLFSIETSNGRRIRSHSYFQQEDEILLPPGTYLKVVGRMSPAEGLHIIHLQEATPPFQLLTPPFDLSKQPVKKPTVHASPPSISSEITTKFQEVQITPPSKAVPKQTASG